MKLTMCIYSQIRNEIEKNLWKSLNMQYVQSNSTVQRLFRFKKSHVTLFHHVLQWFFTSLVFIRWLTLLSYAPENVTRKSLIFWTHVWWISQLFVQMLFPWNEFLPLRNFHWKLERKIQYPSTSQYLSSCKYYLAAMCSSRTANMLLLWFYAFQDRTILIVSYLDCKSDKR